MINMRMWAVVAFTLYLAVVVGAVLYYVDIAERYDASHSANKPGCFHGICNPALQQK